MTHYAVLLRSDMGILQTPLCIPNAKSDLRVNRPEIFFTSKSDFILGWCIRIKIIISRKKQHLNAKSSSEIGRANQSYAWLKFCRGLPNKTCICVTVAYIYVKLCNFNCTGIKIWKKFYEVVSIQTKNTFGRNGSFMDHFHWRHLLAKPLATATLTFARLALATLGDFMTRVSVYSAISRA